MQPERKSEAHNSPILTAATRDAAIETPTFSRLRLTADLASSAQTALEGRLCKSTNLTIGALKALCWLGRGMVNSGRMIRYRSRVVKWRRRLHHDLGQRLGGSREMNRVVVMMVG